jgi:hypothetical protein
MVFIFQGHACGIVDPGRWFTECIYAYNIIHTAYVDNVDILYTNPCISILIFEIHLHNINRYVWLRAFYTQL